MQTFLFDTLERPEEEQEEKRIQELRAKAHKIKQVNSQLLIFIFIIFFVVVPIIIVSIISNKDFYGILLLIFALTSPIFITGAIERKKAEKWKKEHPNDPVNQYL